VISVKIDSEKTFGIRLVACYFLFCVMCLICVLKVAIIATGETNTTANSFNGYRVSIKKQRGTIFDTNMSPITNNRLIAFGAFPPTPEGAIAVSEILSGEEKENALESLRKNTPIVCEINKKITSSSIATAEVTVTKREDYISHIIGYTDSSGHGVCGIEKAYDDLLYSDKSIDAVFTINGKGNVLKGVLPYFENDLSSLSNYVVTTIDNNIQSLSFDCAESLSKGTIIVCEAKTGKIRALVSKPSYDADNLSEYLTREDSPLLNRALSAYSVGSVFKPTVAAAAIENGQGGFTHICTGSSFIVDRNFSCHKKDGHKEMDLKTGLAFSCNTYFYNLGFILGGNTILKYAKALNFGNSVKIGDNLKTESGNLTNKETLSNNAMLANFVIGQGDISLSPISILPLYLSIATDGSYYMPSVIERISKNGEISEYNIGGKTKVMEKSTADTLKEYLKDVVISGTGTEAETDGVEVAGKTATAQTGQFENGIEKTNSWFCGFFPANEPKYVVIVMSEGFCAVSTAKIFSNVAEALSKY